MKYATVYLKNINGKHGVNSLSCIHSIMFLNRHVKTVPATMQFK